MIRKQLITRKPSNDYFLEDCSDGFRVKKIVLVLEMKVWNLGR